MSHFYVQVLLPKPKKKLTREEIEEMVGELLAPYDENLEAPVRKEECYCTGHVAQEEASKKADEQEGTIESLRESFARKYPKESKVHRWGDFTEEEIEKTDKLWDAHIEPRLALQRKLFEEHPLAKAANPECGECKGTGQRETTYNPKSKWDWWVIGGRYTGAVGTYDVEKDPDNYETCFVCGGTGMRNDELGLKARAEDPSYTCNGCDGKGTHLKFPTHWKDVDNTAPVSEFVANFESQKLYLPYAMVTPDGQWLEKGQMGWFGITSNDKSKDTWKEEVFNVLKQYHDALIVVVDCHI